MLSALNHVYWESQTLTDKCSRSAFCEELIDLANRNRLSQLQYMYAHTCAAHVSLITPLLYFNE